MRRLGIIIAMTCLLGLWAVASPIMAQDSEGITAIITEPVNGQQLFGQVQIKGSAAHPSAFASYTLEYDDLSDPETQWFLVQPRIQQQVTTNDVLGVWNTVVVPDGVYQLRLRVTLVDGQSGETIVSNLRVVNSEPTPIPDTAADTAEQVPTPGPSPTSPIEQPPSINPAAGISGLDSGSAPEDSGTESAAAASGDRTTTRINTGRIWRAFCSGVYLTLGGFGIMMAYLLVRGRLRPYTRRLLWQIQDDYRDDL